MLPKSLLFIKGRSCKLNTTCIPRHDKENDLLRKELRRDNLSKM